MIQMLDGTVTDPWQIIADLQQKLDASTAELSEAQERETATAEILEVINSSPGDLGPVFEAILDKAMRLCGAAFGILWRHDGFCFQAAALQGVPMAFAEFSREPISISDSAALGEILRGHDFVHVADL